MTNTTAAVDKSFTHREAPWIKLGKLSDTTLTVDEAIVEGGLGFTVSLRPTRYQNTSGGWSDSWKRSAVVTDDTDEEFEHVATRGYKIIQYADAMSFISAINPKVVAAGTLRNRRQAFMVVELPGLSSITQLQAVDPHDLFAVLRTSHDRTRALEIALMPLRGLCMNMLPLASMTKGVDQRWSIVHSGNVEKQMAAAFDAVSKAEAYAIDYADTVLRLVEHKLSVEDGKKILLQVVRKAPKQEAAVEAIIGLWQNDETIALPDNAWGLVNAVSSYFQWERRGSNSTSTSQFTGALSGQTYQAINRTLVRALRAA